MSRSGCRVVLILVLFTLPATGQEVDRLPPVSEEELPLPPPTMVTPSPGDEKPVELDVPFPVPFEAPSVTTTPLITSTDAPEQQQHEPVRVLNEFWGYRVSEQSMSWAIGDGDQFGRFWLEPDPYRKAGLNSGLTFGLGIGFLSGPQRSDMPPRVFDFSIGYQKRAMLGDLAYDCAVSVLAASDFEGSSRDGIRFPSHAVGYLALTHQVDLVFGADFLDRRDIRVLPVGGLLLRPDAGLRIELVYPRPRVELQVTPGHRLYLYGGLGGGSWAVERDSELDDLASLYELQLGIGLSHEESDCDWSSMELVYLFDRKLEYSSGIGNYDVGSTLMLRTVTQY